jgi:predicted aspartyl protease
MVVYKFDPDSPVIVLFVKLSGPKGTRRVKMALDTGATYVLIPHHIAESLGYDPASSRERVPLTTASGVEIVPLITLISVSALGKKIDNIRVVCHDLPPTSHIDGLLGLSYFREQRIKLDFVEGILEIE